jgi:hypothetical protein
MEFRLRDQGREFGSYSVEQIEAMLDDHQIGMMAEVFDGSQWVTVDELFERYEGQKLQESEEARRQQEETDRREEGDHHKLEIELELERERTRQMKMAPEPPVSRPVVKPSAPQTSEKPLNNGTVISGYVCMGLSLLCCPPLFGLAGLVLGIVNCCLGGKNVMHGAIQVGGTIICTILGVFLGIFIQAFFEGGGF